MPVPLRLARWIALALALLHGLLAVTATIDKSPTFDEPTHLTAGYSYWIRNDFRLDPENGNLPARWAALPLLLEHPKFIPASAVAWQSVSAGLTSRDFFYSEGNDADLILLHSRLMMSVFGALFCLLVFSIGRSLFGPVAGLLAEALAVFDPNLLAHSALVTSDVAATLFFTATAWSCWRLFVRITPASFAFAAISLGGLCLSKMSAPIVLPILMVLALIRMISCRSVELCAGRFRRSFSTFPTRLGVITTVVIGIAGITLFLIWAAYDFRFSALAENGRPRDVLDWRWNYLLSEDSPVPKAVRFARSHRLLPEAYLYGLLFTQQTATSRPAFLDGQCNDAGFLAFFPRAFLYKTPLPLLFVAALAMLAALLRWKGRSQTFLDLTKKAWKDIVLLTPLWSVTVIYGAFALATHLDIGWRHLLPVYPALFISCGAAVCLWQKQRSSITLTLLVLLVTWQLCESFRVRPHYLAYFNQASGGPAEGYHHLVDSSLDWGQDLPSLGEWLHQNRHQDDRVYLGYFGSAEPAFYGIDAEKLPQHHAATPLLPGLYCISATTLQQVYEPYPGRWNQSYEAAYRKGLSWHEGVRQVDLQTTEPDLEDRREQTFHQLQFARLCAFLRRQQPAVEIGYSILIYKVDEAMLRQALLGPPPL